MSFRLRARRTVGKTFWRSSLAIREQTLHAAPRLGEQDRNIIFEQEPPLLQLFEHFIRGGLALRFDAPDVTVDLVVSCRESSELIARLRQPLDERLLIGELVSEL